MNSEKTLVLVTYFTQAKERKNKSLALLWPFWFWFVVIRPIPGVCSFSLFVYFHLDYWIEAFSWGFFMTLETLYFDVNRYFFFPSQRHVQWTLGLNILVMQMSLINMWMINVLWSSEINISIKIDTDPFLNCFLSAVMLYLACTRYNIYRADCILH